MLFNASWAFIESENLAQANKLSRTYAMFEALNRHRGNGEQRLRASTSMSTRVGRRARETGVVYCVGRGRGYATFPGYTSAASWAPPRLDALLASRSTIARVKGTVRLRPFQQASNLGGTEWRRARRLHAQCYRLASGGTALRAFK
jgi:hypothetical protein